MCIGACSVGGWVDGCIGACSVGEWIDVCIGACSVGGQGVDGWMCVLVLVVWVNG